MAGQQIGVVSDRRANTLMGVGLTAGPGDCQGKNATHPQPGTDGVGVDRVLAGGAEVDRACAADHLVAKPSLQFRIAATAAQGAAGLEVAETDGSCAGTRSLPSIGAGFQRVLGRGLHLQLPLVSPQAAAVHQGAGAPIHHGICGVDDSCHSKSSAAGAGHRNGLGAVDSVASLAQQFQISTRSKRRISQRLGLIAGGTQRQAVLCAHRVHDHGSAHRDAAGGGGRNRHRHDLAIQAVALGRVGLGRLLVCCHLGLQAAAGQKQGAAGGCRAAERGLVHREADAGGTAELNPVAHIRALPSAEHPGVDAEGC